jgi:hypothetical protein
MHQVRYEEGRIPKTLRAWLDANAEKVDAISSGAGYATNSGFAYDILLRQGYSTDEGMHTIIEPSIRAALLQLRSVGPCECRQCITTTESKSNK